MGKMKKIGIETVTVLTAAAAIVAPATNVLAEEVLPEDAQGYLDETETNEVSDYEDAKTAFYDAKEEVENTKKVYQKAADDREAALQDLTDVQMGLSANESTVTESKGELQEAIDGIISDAESFVTEKENAMNEAQIDLQNAQQSLTKAEADKQALEAELEELENSTFAEELKAEKVAEAQAALENAESALKSANEELEANNKAFEAAKEVYEKTLADYSVLKQAAEEALSALESAENPDEVYAEAISNAVSSIKEAEANVAEKEAALEAAKQALDAANAIDPASVENPAAVKANKELAAAEQDKTAKEQTVADARTDALQAEINLIEAQNALDEARLSAASLKEDVLSELTAEINALKEKRDEKAAEKKAAEEALAQAESKKISLQNMLDDLDHKITETQTKITDKQNEVNTLKDRISNLTEDADEKEAAVDEKLQQVNDAKALVDDLSQSEQNDFTDSDAYRALQDAQAELAEAQENLSVLMAEHENTAQQVVEAQANYDALVAQKENLLAESNAAYDLYNVKMAESNVMIEEANAYYDAVCEPIPIEDEEAFDAAYAVYEEKMYAAHEVQVLAYNAFDTYVAKYNEAQAMDGSIYSASAILSNAQGLYQYEIDEDLLNGQTWVSEAQAKVVSAQAAYDDYVNKHSGSTALDNAKAALEQAENEYNAAKADAAKANETLQLAGEELAAAVDELSVLSDMLTALNEVHGEKAAELGTLDSEDLQQAAADADAALTAAEEDLSAKQNEYDTISIMDAKDFAGDVLAEKEKAVNDADNHYEGAMRTLDSAERALADAEAVVAEKQAAYEAALVDTSVGEAYKAEEVAKAQSALVVADAGIKDAQSAYAVAQENYSSVMSDYETAKGAYEELKETVHTTKAALDNVSDPSPAFEETKAAHEEALNALNHEIEVKEAAYINAYQTLSDVNAIDADALKREVVAEAQKRLESAVDAVADAEETVDDAKDMLNVAEEALEEAINALNAAKGITVDGAASAVDLKAYLGNNYDALKDPTQTVKEAIEQVKKAEAALADAEDAFEDADDELEKAEKAYSDALSDFGIATADILQFIQALSIGSYHWTLGGTDPLTVLTSGRFEEFAGVLLDGKLINTDNYQVEAGSTILTFSPEYLNSLSTGTHSLTVLYGQIYSDLSLDNSVSTSINVQEASLNENIPAGDQSDKNDVAKSVDQSDNNDSAKSGNQDNDNSAIKTGDESQVALFASLFGSASAALSALFILKKRKKDM